MRKGTNGHCIFGKLRAYVWRAEAVSNTRKLGRSILVPVGHSLHPLRDRFVRKSRVLPFPRFIVEVRVRDVVTVLAVLPDGIL